MFKLGGSLFKKQEEEAEIVINENMMLDALDTNTRNDLINLFAKVQAASNSPPLENVAAMNADLKFIHDETKAQIFGPLISVANQIDNGNTAVNDYKEELNNSQTDLLNAPHARAVPTQFIVRSVAKLHKKSLEVSQSIAAYSSKFQSIENSNRNNSIGEMFKSENKAMLRCATKFAHIRSRYESLRNLMIQKLPASTIAKIEDTEEATDKSSIAESIELSYKAYQTEQKSKFDKWIQDIDLFGASTVIAAPQATSTFGTGKFGSGASKFGSSTASTGLKKS